ncbi:MAG TPA: hypothetical protein VGP08_25220 [Pyrinomonadaceae bacterium]|jgi:hypothetical protein|nr:hypothetical protein [Pyrinomonadaceae bacterium]
MRRLALTLTLAILALLPFATPRRAAVARTALQQCPAVKVTCLDSISPGEELTFSAEVDTAASAVKNTFKWELSAGTITEGQGTPSLKVDSTGVGVQTVTATVEVAGLPAACASKSSCTTAVLKIIGCGFDEYGNIRFEDEKARLDNLAIELQNDPTASGYLLCYGGRVGYEGEARRRCDRAKKYISEVRGIPADHIVTVDGGFREDLTVRLVVVPAGATPPEPTPTVDAGEVTILKPKAARKPRGR